ncbi:energy transducer TonB [bacterium]|nr:energy transducer TonB [bacterium]MBU1957814.1 energy transducer TonB [bacterium]
MTKTRYGFSFLISSFIYVILGLLSLSFLENSTLLKKSPEAVIKIAIINPIPEIIPQKIITPIIPAPEPVVVVPPKKVEKPKLEPKKIIKKVVKKPKPKPKKVIKKPTPKPTPKKIVKESKPVHHTQAPTKVLQAVATAQAAVSPKVNKSAEKRAFLNQVRSKIIANKKYSKIALRRHIEGSVKVKFDIIANGSVSNIRFVNGKPILQKSVREAITKSFPIRIPNSLKDQLPMYNISVTVNFQIK